MPTRKRQHGFTIIELMVTMTILGLMLFLVNELFNDTSQAVQTSIQTSKTIATSRSINEQFTQDLDAMMGPGLNNDGGYIVIIQQRIPNATMTDPRTLTDVQVTELRTDQLLFIRDGEGLRSMTPASDNNYGTNFIGQPGDRAKVWYGHALRTLSNGLPHAGTLGSANAEFDRIGNDFIFGRQAMLFNPTNLDTGAKLRDVSTGVITPNVTYAEDGYDESIVSGATGYPGTNQTYLGLTDITDQNYGPVSTPGTLLNQLSVITPPETIADKNSNYINTAYPQAANRLRVNTAPDPDATNYASWAIAQGHPILAQGCSEIIIDFAADLNGNGRVDREFGGGTDIAGAIHWYDGLKQASMGDPANNGTWVQQTGFPQPQVTDGTDTQAFIFRVDDATSFDDAGGTVGLAGTPHSHWPYLIRIRYRLHDTRGRLEGNYAAALTDNLDNDGDGDTDEAGEDRIAGRWFERIISVPRP